jgi:LmbE family N-acetylglucosaminyl deacetylase/ActR/RegA family two-component response regulator
VSTVDEPPLRVLVIDDDPDSVLLMTDVLARRGGMAVSSALNPDDGLAALDDLSGDRHCDVVVTDVEMPGMTGLDLLSLLRERYPDLPVVVVTAHATVDYAVGALRGQAGEFLHKPLDPDELLGTVHRLGTESRSRSAAGRQSILAVGAHPDDVEIGVGGMLSAHHARGDRITIVTLTNGARGGSSTVRQDEARAAASLVGAQLHLADLEDTRIPVSDPTMSTIQNVIAEVDPDVVYVHSLNDLHQDHRAAHQATMVAARKVPTVGCYQSPSATVDFRPNRFAVIDDHVDDKLKLLACFGSQTSQQRDYLEPDLVVATARYWSRYGGGRFAEALEVIRDEGSTNQPTNSRR